MSLRNKITELNTLKRSELLGIWTKAYGKAPPRGLSRKLVIKGIAYRWQEMAYGGLSESVKKRLKKMSEALALNPNDFLPTEVKIKSGTRIYREYDGITHEVIVQDEGFMYDGKKYASLTAIAKLITGTQYNGHVFFGLKKDKRYVSP